MKGIKPEKGGPWGQWFKVQRLRGRDKRGGVDRNETSFAPSVMRSVLSRLPIDKGIQWFYVGNVVV
jgi:hypothetical protein